MQQTMKIKKDTEYNIMNRKLKTKRLVKTQITRYEKNMTQKIMKERGRKKWWQLINTLRGKSKHNKEKAKLYNDDETEILISTYPENIKSVWSDIYRMHSFDYKEEWSTTKKE